MIHTIKTQMGFLVAVEKIEAKIEKDIIKQKEIRERIRVIENNIVQLQEKMHEIEQSICTNKEIINQRLQDKKKIMEAQEKERRRIVQNKSTENSLMYLKVLFQRKSAKKSRRVVKVVRKKPNMLGARL